MNKKILIVRGDQQSSKALSFMLAGSGYQISSHRSAGDAIEAARQHRFDLAITDEDVPENSPKLDFVASLKEAQPSLPVFYLTEEQNLDKVISCIRAGVTEIIANPRDLKNVFETTRNFLKGGKQPDPDEVTWEDMLQVERLLESSGQSAGLASPVGGADPAQLASLKEQVQKLLNERDRANKDLADSIETIGKLRSMIEQFKSEGQSTDSASLIERMSELDKREKSLEELSARVSKQKVLVETELAELEAQRFEIEEARKDLELTAARSTPSADGSTTLEAEQLKAQLEAEAERYNTLRLDYEARIHDLERAVEKAKARSPDDEGKLIALSMELQEARETIAEKDFVIDQQERKLATAMEQKGSVSNAAMEELESEKRLLEVEKFRLQEKLDQLHLEKRQIEEAHSKNQRELQVERRDAEVSLRELQNQVKEHQLKLKVDQAQFQEEVRRFEQARQNFQEDIQDLQQKQNELRKLEAFLRQREQSMGTPAANALPASEEAPDLSVLDARLGSSHSQAPSPATALTSEAAPQSQHPEEEGAPDKWAKPNFDKKAGRGPLRIGRRSSF